VVNDKKKITLMVIVIAIQGP